MRVFGLRKERLDPHLAFVQAFLVDVRLMEGPHALKRFFCHIVTEPTPGFAGVISCFDRAGITDVNLSSVLLELVCTSRRQFGCVGTKIAIMFRIIAEITLPKELRALVKIGKRNVGTNVLLLKGGDNFCASVGRASWKLMRPQFPVEAPEEIKHGLVFHDLRRSRQDGQDDAHLSSVYHIVRMIT
jgi:hypothetical protein